MKVLVTLTCVVAVASRPAPTADLLILGTSTTTTAVAGGNGTDVRTLGPTGNYQGLYEIRWAEDSDIPCWFRVRSRHLNTASVQTNDLNLGGASCAQTSSSERVVIQNQANRYLTGIAVCRNNQRIKGISAYYSDVGTSAGTWPWGAETATQDNCTSGGSWSPARHCPTGQIATQLLIYYKSDTPAFSSQIKEAATGIALVCRKVELK
ncbi:MAG: hypothetical protein AB7L66_16150 [Gemmatimonadales bacterium]